MSSGPILDFVEPMTGGGARRVIVMTAEAEAAERDRMLSADEHVGFADLLRTALGHFSMTAADVSDYTCPLRLSAAERAQLEAIAQIQALCPCTFLGSGQRGSTSRKSIQMKIENALRRPVSIRAASAPCSVAGTVTQSRSLARGSSGRR